MHISMRHPMKATLAEIPLVRSRIIGLTPKSDVLKDASEGARKGRSKRAIGTPAWQPRISCSHQTNAHCIDVATTEIHAIETSLMHRGKLRDLHMQSRGRLIVGLPKIAKVPLDGRFITVSSLGPGPGAPLT